MSTPDRPSHRRRKRDYAYPRGEHSAPEQPAETRERGKPVKRRRVRHTRSKTIFEESNLSSSFQALLFILVIVAAIALCQIRLDASHFNLTESRVALLLDRSLGTVIADRDATPLSRVGLVLLSNWRELAGGSTFALRQWSMITGLLAIGALYLGARRIVGRRAALWGAFVLALSPAWYVHSRSLLALHLVTLATALWLGSLHRYLCEPTRSNAIGFGTSLALALVVHPACLLLVPIGLWMTRATRGSVVRVSQFSGIAAVVTAPIWLGELHTLTAPYEFLPGLPAIGVVNPISWVPGIPFGNLAGGPAWAIGAGIGVAIMLLALGFIGMKWGEPESFLRPRSDRAPRSTRFLRPVLFVWVAGAALSFLTGAWAQAWGLMVFPVAALFVGAGIERVVRHRAEHDISKGEAGYRQLEARLANRRATAGIVLALLSAPAIAGYVSQLGTWTESDPRARASFLSGRVRNGDVLVTIGAERELVGYALSEMAAPRIDSVERAPAQRAVQADSLAGIMIAGRRVWISVASDADDGGLLDTMNARGYLHSVLTDSLLGVYCFSAPGDSVPFDRIGS
jgi:hypothetical protein